MTTELYLLARPRAGKTLGWTVPVQFITPSEIERVRAEVAAAVKEETGHAPRAVLALIPGGKT